MADRLIAIADGKPGCAAIHQEGGDAFLWPARGVINAGGHKDDHEICMIGARNKMLGAIEHPIATLALCRAGHAAHIRACTRFGHRQSVHFLAAHRRQQIALFLIALASHKDILRPAKEMIKRHAATAQFALNQRKFKMAQARTADLFRKVAGVKPQIKCFLFDLLGNISWHRARAFNRVLMWVNFIFHKTADRINDHLLFIG